MAQHSSEARRVRRELDKELAESGTASGRELVWRAGFDVNLTEKWTFPRTTRRPPSRRSGSSCPERFGCWKGILRGC